MPYYALLCKARRSLHSNQKRFVVMEFYLFAVLLFLPTVFGRDATTPKYVIDLDLPPEERWAKVAEDYASDFGALLLQIEEMFPKDLVIAVSDLTGELDRYFPYPYADEMRGIVKFAGGNFTLGQVILGNLLYDLTAYRKPKKHNGACTSIVAADKHGFLLHGRNLDYALSNKLRDMTIIVQFKTKSNPNVFTGTTFAGFIGILTGCKPGGISISLDERDVGDWWQNAMSALKEGSNGLVSLLIRDVLQTESDDFSFVSAVEKLSSTPIIAPCYLIIAGQLYTEGVVITRDRTAALDKWYLNPDKGEWFILETNYDHWKPAPSDDDRRDPGFKVMNSIGRDNINTQTLFQVMSTDPVLNHKTTYTTIMSPGKAWFFNTTIRYL